MREESNIVEFKINGSDDKIEFYVMEQVTINNATYLLVTENEDDELDELEAYILKEAETENEEVVYDILENEEEIAFVSRIFEEKMEDFDLE